MFLLTESKDFNEKYSEIFLQMDGSDTVNNKEDERFFSYVIINRCSREYLREVEDVLSWFQRGIWDINILRIQSNGNETKRLR